MNKELVKIATELLSINIHGYPSEYSHLTYITILHLSKVLLEHGVSHPHEDLETSILIISAWHDCIKIFQNKLKEINILKNTEEYIDSSGCTNIKFNLLYKIKKLEKIINRFEIMDIENGKY